MQGKIRVLCIIIGHMNLTELLNKKVLVIDDDPAMTDILRLLLQTEVGLVITANSGVEGLELAHQESPDIIILDLMMPQMDGWEVCKLLREFSKVPIIILSALDNPAVVASALDSGADDYLIKPVTSNTLLLHIANLLRRMQYQVGSVVKETIDKLV